MFYKNTYVVGTVNRGVNKFIIMNEIKAYDNIDVKQVSLAEIAADIRNNGAYECENFSWDGRTFTLNGLSCGTPDELFKMLTATNNYWLVTERLTDNNGNNIGIGVLANRSYVRVTEADVIKHIRNFANAYVRDGSVVNKCKVTPKTNIMDTVSNPAPVAKSNATPNVLSGSNMGQGTVQVNSAAATAPTVPTVPTVAKPSIVTPSANSVGNTMSEEDLKRPSGQDDYDRMKFLVDVLNRAAYVYEQGEDEIMSNKTYDALFDELKDLEKKTGCVYDDSPTQGVGFSAEGSKLEKREHDTPMLSLDKTKDVADLKKFLGPGKEGLLSWKLDGLTVVTKFRNRRLVEATTRGNGYIGELVTENAKTFVNIPERISRLDEIVLRGEAIISYPDFEKIKQTAGGQHYKNPRNLCSGSVRNLDSNVTASRNVRYIVFEWVNAPDGMSKEAELEFIRGLGFETVQSLKVNRDNIEAAVSAFKKAIEKNAYPSDGLVLTFDDVAYGKQLGLTARAPKHSIAFKWQDEDKVTTLIDIEWTPGRSGVITPTAIFEPVDIDGTTVTRASLHNISVMEQLLGTPYVGQKIWVYKANMIIPQISKAVKSTDLQNGI